MLTPSLRVVLFGFFDHFVEATGGYVLLNLLIPNLSMKLLEPFS